MSATPRQPVPLSPEQQVRIHNVLLACAEFRLWEAWMCSLPTEAVEAIRADARARSEQARREAQAVASQPATMQQRRAA